MTNPKPIRRRTRKTIYSNLWTTMYVDDIILPDGQIGQYALVEKQDAVLIIPTLEDRFLLVHQYRYPINEWTWEFPQGGCEPQETPLEAAHRELREETGYQICAAHILNMLCEAPGLTTHKLTVIHAEVNEQTYPNIENSETDIITQWFKLSTLHTMVRMGELQEAMSVAALLCYSLYR